MQFALVRCRAPNGIKLTLFELQDEIPGYPVQVGRPATPETIAKLGVHSNQVELLHADQNVVPMAFWSEWQKQHPAGVPMVDMIGVVNAPDESPRAT